MYPEFWKPHIYMYSYTGIWVYITFRAGLSTHYTNGDANGEGFIIDATNRLSPIVENQMEKKMDNQMEAGIM